MAHDFADDEDLFDRLTARPNDVVYLVGSAVTAPCQGGASGVLGVEGVIDTIRDGLGSPHSRARFDDALVKEPNNRYQAAFRFALQNRGPDFANAMFRRNVLRARVPSTRFPIVHTDVEGPELGRELEQDLTGWQLTPAVTALGVILARQAGEKRSIVLTTNADPLLGISIRRVGGTVIHVALHDDAHLSGLDGRGCLVVQLHGDWCRGDILNLRSQRGRERPKLAANLAQLLSSRTLVVLGHSGGDNILLRSLVELVRSEGPISVAWAFHAKDPAYIQDKYAALLDDLGPGIDGGRVVLYKGIDVHEFLPALAERLYGPTVETRADKPRQAAIRRPTREREGFLRLVCDEQDQLPSDVAAAGISAMPAGLALDALRNRASTDAAAYEGELRELRKYQDVIFLAVQVLAIHGHCSGWVGMTTEGTPTIVLDNGHVVLADELPPDESELLLARGLLREPGAPVAIVVPRTRIPGVLPTSVWNAYDEIRRRAYAYPYLRRCARFIRQHAGVMQARTVVAHGETLQDAVHRWLESGPAFALLVGHVGSGRTTALDLLAAELAREALERPHAPLVIRLRADDLVNEDEFYAALQNEVGDDRADAVLLALRYGQCIALIDDADRSQWLAQHGLPDRLLHWALAFVGAGSPRSRALVAWSPGMPQDRLGPTLNLHLAPLATEPASLRELRPNTADALRFTWCVHHLARSRPAYFGQAWVARLSAYTDQQTYARAAEALVAYLRAWAEHAALWSSDRPRDFFLTFVEAVARSAWRREPGVVRGKVPWSLLVQRFPELGLPLSCDHESVAWVVDGTVLVRGDHAVARTMHDAEAWLDAALRCERASQPPADPFVVERDPWGSNHPASSACVQLAFPGLLDFLIARSVIDGLMRGDRGALDLPRLSPAVLGFIREDPAWHRIRGEIQSILLADPVPRISENALFIALTDPSLRSSAEAPWQLRRARLREAVLSAAPLEHANLDEADLERCVLCHAHLGSALLRGANLRHAQLQDADLQHASCRGADFTAAWLDNTQMQNADLRDSILSASTATTGSPQVDGADLSGALRWATMWGASAGDSQQDITIIGPGECSHFHDITWSPAIEAPVLAAGTRGGYLCLIEPHRGRIYARWLAHPQGPLHVAFSPDGRILASFVERRPGVRLWRVVDGTEVVSPLLNTVSATRVTWAKNHVRLAVFTGESSPLVVDVHTGTVQRLSPGTRNCHGGAFACDDSRLVGFTEHDPRLHEWDLGAVEQPPVELGTSPGVENVQALTSSRDGSRLIVSGVAKCWLLKHEASSWKAETQLGSSSWHDIAEFDPSGAMACVFDDHHSLTLKSLHDPHKRLDLRDDQRRIDMIEATCFSGDGAMLAALDHSGDLWLWDTQSGQLQMRRTTQHMGVCSAALDAPRATLRIGCYESIRWIESADPRPTHRHSTPGRCLALSDDGALSVIVDNDDLTLHGLSGTQTPTLLATRTNRPGRWGDARFSEDGAILWAHKIGEEDEGLHAWQFRGERPLPLDKVDSSRASVLAWSTAGQDVAYLARERRAGASETLLIVRTGGVRRQHVLRGEDQYPQYQIALSHESIALVTQFGDVFVRARDDLEAPPRWRQTPGSRSLGTLMFSPSGDLLAVAAGSRVELYDALSGTSVAALPGHERVPLGIRWTTHRILTWTSDTIRIWHSKNFSLLGTVHVVKDGALIATSAGYCVVGEVPIGQFHVQRGRDCVPLAAMPQLRHDEADAKRELATLFGVGATP